MSGAHVLEVSDADLFEPDAMSPEDPARLAATTYDIIRALLPAGVALQVLPPGRLAVWERRQLIFQAIGLPETEGFPRGYGVKPLLGTRLLPQVLSDALASIGSRPMRPGHPLGLLDNPQVWMEVASTGTVRLLSRDGIHARWSWHALRGWVATDRSHISLLVPRLVGTEMPGAFGTIDVQPLSDGRVQELAAAVPSAEAAIDLLAVAVPEPLAAGREQIALRALARFARTTGSVSRSIQGMRAGV